MWLTPQLVEDARRIGAGNMAKGIRKAIEETKMDNKWTVKHFWHNPANNSTHEFSNRAEAEAEARKMQADDPEDAQVSEIKGPHGEYGERLWSKRRISWSK